MGLWEGGFVDAAVALDDVVPDDAVGDAGLLISEREDCGLKRPVAPRPAPLGSTSGASIWSLLGRRILSLLGMCRIPNPCSEGRLNGPATLVSAAHIDSALVQHVYLMDPGKGIFERREAVRGKHWRSLRSTE